MTYPPQDKAPKLDGCLRCHVLTQVTGDIVFACHGDGQLVTANSQFWTEYGYPPDELPRLSLGALTAPGAAARAAEDDSTVTRFESTHCRKDGTTFPVEITTYNATLDAEPVCVYLVRDVTQRQRTEATRKLLHSLDNHILHRRPLTAILQHMVDRIQELFGFTLVWVGTKEPDSTVKVLALAGDGAVVKAVPVRWDHAVGGDGPTGAAIRTGEPQLYQTSNPELEGWASRVRAYGIQASLAVPLQTQGQVLGVLSLSDARAQSFDPRTVQLLTTFADQAAISLSAAQDHEQIALRTAALEATASAVVITNHEGTITWTNTAFTDLTGYDRDEAIGNKSSILKSGHQSQAFYQELWQTITAGGTWRGELYNRRKDGSLYVEEQTITPVRTAGGAISHYIGIKNDVTDRKHQEQQLRYLAMFDPVTDLPNRTALNESLKRAVEGARAGQQLALLLLDVDEFNLVKSSIGHTLSRELLSGVARRLRDLVRPFDMLARLEEDEFAVLLEDADPDSARRLAEVIRQGVAEKSFQIGGRMVSLGLSIGVAPVSGSDADEVTALASAALHTAKEQGKNRVVLFRSGDMHRRFTEANEWVTRIREALREDRFVLYFQPIVNLASGGHHHVEALIRMRGEDGTLHSPAAFLPAAERFGLMPAIDRWVVDKALDVLRARPDRTIFINLSGQSLGDDTLLIHIENRLRECRSDAERLAFEITETSAVKDPVLAKEWMLRLQDLGCRFALDDFGVGFSSFGYLRVMPFDFVKMDGTFIRTLDTDPSSLALVQAMTTMARSLGKQIVAEWVESEATAAQLRELGVTFGQGYLWGAPGPIVPAP